MNEFYKHGYWEGRVDRKDLTPTATRVANSRAIAVKSMLRGKVGNKSLVMEIGCGDGNILAHLRDSFGCRVRGLEPSLQESEKARKEFGIEVDCGTLDDVDSETHEPDAIVLSHVLEHFHDPRAALRHCHNLLLPRGWLFVEVPNMYAPTCSKRLSTWLAVEHMYYFSPSNLRHLLEEAGFHIEQSEFTNVIRFVAQKAQLSNPSPALRPIPTNEYRHVMASVYWHEIQYWPRYAVKRLLSAITRR